MRGGEERCGWARSEKLIHDDKLILPLSLFSFVANDEKAEK
jgi:hypothetical protein